MFKELFFLRFQKEIPQQMISETNLKKVHYLPKVPFRFSPVLKCAPLASPIPVTRNTLPWTQLWWTFGY